MRGIRRQDLTGAQAAYRQAHHRAPQSQREALDAGHAPKGRSPAVSRSTGPRLSPRGRPTEVDGQEGSIDRKPFVICGLGAQEVARGRELRDVAPCRGVGLSAGLPVRENSREGKGLNMAKQV